MSTNDEILEHVKRRAGDPTTRTDNEDLRANEIVAPATEAEITVAESAFGVQLPLVLRQLYTRIGNGGFGPGYGLLGVPPHGYRDDQRHTGLELYALFSQFDPDDAAWDWPDALVPICHWGCAIYSCVDCTNGEGRMILWDPNAHEEGQSPRSAMRAESPSVAEWLSRWASGENLWEAMFPPGAT